MSAQDHIQTRAAHDPVADRSFGFWLFLLGDVILFALLAATYVVMSTASDGGPTGPELFGLGLVAIYTALLLCSTLSMGFASIALEAANTRAALAWLAATFVLGAAFLGLELNEFLGLIRDGAGPDRSGFLSAYFTLVGTHGLHVAVGLIWMIVMAVHLLLGHDGRKSHGDFDRLATFWHLVGIVWIVIYSVVFLPAVIA